MFHTISGTALARIQFAFSGSFHFIFPSFPIGLARYLMVLEGLWLKIGRDVYLPCKVPSSPGAVTAVAGRTGFSIFRF